MGFLTYSRRFPTGFSGGKSQVNPNFLQDAGGYPFINMMKTGGRWGWINTPTVDALTPNLFDNDGYPIASAKFTAHGGVGAITSIPPTLSALDNWILDWSGGGTVAMIIGTGSGSITTVSGSGTSSPWEITISSTITSVIIQITAVGPTNMRFYHKSEKGRLDSGQIFSAKFMSRLAEAKFGIIRFLNWQSGNNSLVTNWDVGNRPVSYFQYSLSQFRTDLLCNSAGSGITTNSGADYSVSVPSTWTGLTDKATIHIVFNANSPTSATITFTGGGSPNITWTSHGLATGNQIYFTTTGTLPAGLTPSTLSGLGVITPSIYYFVTVVDANTVTVAATSGGATLNFATAGTGTTTGRTNCTLNVGSTGAVQILNELCSQLTASGNAFPVGSGGDGSLATLTYDASINAWIKTGGSGSSAGITNGVPISLCLRLCNEAGAHPWFISPQMACTPMTDWHTQLATLCKNTMPSWMIPYIEGPNELWNTSPAFYQTNYACAVGQSYGWGAGDFNNWYGKVMSTIGQAVNAVYGGAVNGSKYRIVCATQAASMNSAGNNDPRLKSTKYLVQTPQSGYTATQAAGWCTEVALGHYITPWTFGYINEIKLAGQYYVTNAGNPTAQDTVAATYAAGLPGGGITTVSASTFTLSSHGFVANQPVQALLIYGGTMPTGLVVGTQYFVRATNLTTNTFELATSEGGSAISCSGGSGTFYVVAGAASSAPNIVAQNVLYQNAAIWAAGISGLNAVTKVHSYEGGIASGGGYTSGAVTSVVTAATKTNPMVLTLSTSSNQGIRAAVQTNASFETLVPGVYLTLTGFTDPNWTSLNGTTVLVNTVVGGTITTTFDASARAADLASGTATATYVLNAAATLPYHVAITALRYAIKNTATSQGYLTTDYNNLVAVSSGAVSGGSPSLFQMEGNTKPFTSSSVPSNNWWSVLEDIYQSPDPPQWLAIKAFNA